MKVQKRVSVGSFLKKGEDIKDKDIVIIANEGKEVEGEFGMQNLFMLKVKVTDPITGKDSVKEGNVSLNQTSINALIDAYGDDTKTWIGKNALVWAILQNVQGKMKKVYYFTHPKAEIDEDGNFTLPPGVLNTTPVQSATVVDNSQAPEPTEEELNAMFGK